MCSSDLVTEIDPASLLNADGTFKENLNEVPPEVRRAIKKFKAKNLYEFDENGIKTTVGKLVEVEFFDKLKAAEMLGSEVDLFKKTTVMKHDVTDNMADVLLSAEKRAEERIKARREREVIELGPGVSDATTVE